MMRITKGGRRVLDLKDLKSTRKQAESLAREQMAAYLAGDRAAMRKFWERVEKSSWTSKTYVKRSNAKKRRQGV
jgi:hypothetical protein